MLAIVACVHLHLYTLISEMAFPVCLFSNLMGIFLLLVSGLCQICVICRYFLPICNLSVLSFSEVYNFDEVQFISFYFCGCFWCLV